MTLDVDGVEPAIVGLRCEELIAIEYFHGGKLVDAATVVHLKFAGEWHRLYFDCGIVYWRNDGQKGPDPAFDMEELHARCVPVDIGHARGLVGARLDRIRTERFPEQAPFGTRVRLEFDGRRRITFQTEDAEDVTTYS